jgi:drug/metabolite transporter (DMT)-like permease
LNCDPAVIRSLSAIAPTALALGAVALWSLLALLAVRLSGVPPFLLLGLALGGAGLLALPSWRSWRVAPATLLLGIYGLFGFHLLLFLALRNAPAIEANLVNYLWPLLIVLLAPWLLPGVRLTWRHVVAVTLGVIGAALLISGGRWTFSSAYWQGYAFAAGSAFVWATYSLLTRRVAPFPTAAVGFFCLLSGALALVCHVLLEPHFVPSAVQAMLIVLLALGPMGAAFFLWDAALKRGDPRTIGALSYLTPLGSTLCLLAAGVGTLTPVIGLAALLIIGGAVLGATRAE